MDLANTVIGVVLFFAIALPIYYINNASKKKRIILQNKLINLFTSKPMKISDYDTFGGDSIIGIHENEVCFYQERNNQVVSKVINWKEIARFSVVKEFTKMGKQSDKKLSRVVLSFDFKDKSKDSDVILFFQVDETNFMIGEELRIATKWEEKLNQMLKS